MAEARAEAWECEQRVEQGNYGQIHFAPSIKSLTLIVQTLVFLSEFLFFFFFFCSIVDLQSCVGFKCTEV